MKNFSSKMSSILVLSSLIFLPSCQWLKDTFGIGGGSSSVAGDSSVAVATIDGKTLVSKAEFEKYYKEFIESHPYGAMIAQMEDVEPKMLEGLITQKLVTKHIEDNKYHETPEYQKYWDQLKQYLNMQTFAQKHPVTVTDADLREYYDKNRDTMPEAMLSRGGINTTGVEFANEADAKAFLEKAKGKGATLEKVAKDNNLGNKFKDFKLVNSISVGVEPALRDKILTLKKFPSLEMVKAKDNSVWVIYVSGKEEAKYRPFDEIKRSLEQRLTSKKQEENIQSALEQLKKEYKVEINQDYFKNKAQERAKQPAEQLINEEQLEMVMPEGNQENAAAKPAAPAQVA